MNDNGTLNKSDFDKFKTSDDELARAWKAFAHEVVAAKPMPADWFPIQTPIATACKSLFV